MPAPDWLKHPLFGALRELGCAISPIPFVWNDPALYTGSSLEPNWRVLPFPVA